VSWLNGLTPMQFAALVPHCERCEVFMRRIGEGAWQCPRCGSAKETDEAVVRARAERANTDEEKKEEAM